MGANRDSQRLALPHDDDEALAPCDRRVDEISCEHRIVLRRQRDDHGGVFRSLRLVDRRRIGGNERVQFAERVFANLCLRIPKWYRAVTAGMLPPRLRIAFGLDYVQAEQRIAESMTKWIRRVYPLLPDRLRYVGPYQEAMARLSGRTRPDLLTRLIHPTDAHC